MARARLWRSVFRYCTDENEAAMGDVESGLPTARALGLQPEVAIACTVQGGLMYDRGEVEAGRERLRAGLAAARASGDQRIVGDVLQELARTYGSDGDASEGKRLAEECLQVSRATGRLYLTAQAMLRLSYFSSICGEYGEAERDCRESLELFERVGNQYGTANALGQLAWVLWCSGASSVQEARALQARSLAMLRALGVRQVIANQLADNALLEVDGGNPTLAEAYAREGLEIGRALGSVPSVITHCTILGEIASARHDFDTSRRYLSAALRRAAETGRWPMVAVILFHVATLLRREAGGEHPSGAPVKARTLELLVSIADYSALWLVYKTRARRLCDELRRELPQEIAEGAAARGRRLDWRTAAGSLLEELGRPSPALGLAPAA